MPYRKTAGRLHLILAPLAGLLWSMALQAQQPGEESATALQAPPLAIELNRQLELRSGPYASQRHWEQLTAFYSPREYQPVWVDEHGPNSRAATLREALQQAYREGLESSSYPLPLIELLWRSEGVTQRIALELLLSDTFFDYSRELLSGQLDPLWSGQLWYIPMQEVDPVALLQAMMGSDNFAIALKGLPPNHPAYRRLREALARYRQIEQNGGWPAIAAGKTLRPGMSDGRVPQLRQRLLIEGELQFAPLREPQRYDEALRYAVERFQLRHGLKVDGVVGPLTLAEINMPVSRRIAQIRLNMERWRWLPEQLGHRHIIVNLSAYQLSAYDHGERQFTMDAIIGTHENPSPQITGKLHTVVFNPYWAIPKKIALEEVIPKQQRNPRYFASRGIRVFSDWSGGRELDPRKIDWSRLGPANFHYMLRQDPGPDNPLGKLKFLFNNNFRVYLHDTPAQQLFSKTERSFSHGCIRVEAPRRLAAFLLAGEPDSPWSEAAVRALIANGLTREEKITPPVPVYLLYLTAWAGDDGAVHFRRDVYGEDELLLIDLPEGELY